ncbi:MAG: SpoIID/LytB domain-containing protein, partial [Clostridiales bacterium]|nr:SpoIID/LytB domain-containing protein [Clostridiales bacterium]
MKRLFAIVLSFLLLITLTFSSYAAPMPVGELSSRLLIRVGLRYGENALSSANLQNTVGYGSGYKVGYYDPSDNFIPLAQIDSTEITIRASGSTYTISNTTSGTMLTTLNSSGWTLAVVPQSLDGTPTRTWFKNNIYNGAFEYVRNSNGSLNVVNVINIEDYIKGILPYEMSPKWPLEALKAQALAARSFAVYTMDKHRSQGFDLCNTIDCQVYYGVKNANENTDTAVEQTRGMYITYNGEPINAVYHSSNGGATEHSENIWSRALPYLRAVRDDFESQTNMTNKSWNYEITLSELTSLLRARGNDIGQIVHAYAEYTESGNVEKLVFIDNNGKKLEYEKERARSVLKNSDIGINVRSQRFIFEDKANPRINSVGELMTPMSRAAYLDQSIITVTDTPVLAYPDTKSVITSYGMLPMLSGLGSSGSFKVLSSSGIYQVNEVFTVGGAGIIGAVHGTIDGSALSVPGSSSGTF